MNKLPSLTIFFPFYNDSGTVKQQIESAYTVGNQLTNDLEVIAIHGGNSKDDTLEQILLQKEKYPELVVIDKSDNTEGYAVIKHGFYNATKEFVFYTDGDAQYYLEELPDLVKVQLLTNCDVVNGFKVRRKDNVFRIFFGKIYQYLSAYAFRLPIRDTDCDFRLIRTSFFENIKLTSTNASILPEMIHVLHRNHAKFKEVPVKHRDRQYGRSNYSAVSLAKEKIIGDLKLLYKLYFKAESN